MIAVSEPAPNAICSECEKEAFVYLSSELWSTCLCATDLNALLSDLRGFMIGTKSEEQP